MQNKAEKIEYLLQQYGSSLFRLCLFLLKNEADAEDVIQETFLKYLQKAPTFADAEHEKAWLFRVASNACLDILRYQQRHPQEEPDVERYLPTEPKNTEILDALLGLPEKYRLVLILYYVEGYRINEIAEIIRKSPSAVKMRLQKGRKLLKTAYGKEER
ncbi:MAG: RNA polymerase sigma factor [Anaerotignum sp.]|nr:RNA polymerase sigma factor [Anaerotignum sp.]